MESNPYRSPRAGGNLPEKSGPWRPNLLMVLAGIALLAILAALMLPSQRVAREPSRRASCGNNLKNIGLALRAYEARHGALPPARIVDEEGRPLHSWRTLILPYLDHKALYDKIDLSKPWDDPVNKVAFETAPDIYCCPSSPVPAMETTYLAIVAPGSCFQATRGRLFSEITDEKDLTLMVIEVDRFHAVHWMSPTDAAEQDVLDVWASRNHSHQSGANVLDVSGRVRFLDQDATPEQLRALISIAGKDDDLARQTK